MTSTHPLPGTVLVGVDASSTSELALTWAAEPTSLEGRPLTLVTHCFFDAMGTWDGPSEIAWDTPGYETDRLVIDESVAGMREKLPDVGVRLTFGRGLVDTYLVEVAATMDMVVVGAHADTLPFASILERNVDRSVVTSAASVVPRSVDRSTQGMSVTAVQRWLLTILTIPVIEHLAAGVALAGVPVGAGNAVPRAGLLVISGILSTLGVVAVLVIHGRRPLSAWLLLGLVVPLMGTRFRRRWAPRSLLGQRQTATCWLSGSSPRRDRRRNPRAGRPPYRANVVRRGD